MGYTYVGDNRKINAYLGQFEVYRMYYGNIRVYPNAGNVTYIVDNNVSYIEEVDIDDSCLSPTTFTPTKSGWTFIGWREDTSANGTVLSSKIMDGNDVTLYAVFRQTITLSYNGNTSTGGSMTSQTGTRYYNNGNYNNPSFILKSNGFSKTNSTFINWARGSVSGVRMSPGTSITLSENTVFYAKWNVRIETTQTLTGRRSGWYQESNDVDDSGTTHVTFSTKFDVVPTVSVNCWWTSHVLDSKYYSYGSSNVTTSGFDLWISIWETGAVNYQFNLDWTAKGTVYTYTEV